MELVFEKIATKDGRRLKLKHVEMLKKDELPERYLGAQPYCYKNQEGLYITRPRQATIKYQEMYTKSEIVELLEVLHICGERLGKINAEIREENEGWTGTITYEI